MSESTDNPIADIFNVQVKFVPTEQLLRIDESGEHPVVSVPVEISTVLQYLMSEGYLQGSKRFIACVFGVAIGVAAMGLRG